MTFHKTGGNMLGAASVSPYKEDITIGDYIKRKEEAYKPKLSFKEWFALFLIEQGLPETHTEFDKVDLLDAFRAGQANAK